MNFSQFLLILRARQKIVLVAMVLTVLTALAVSLLLPKTYKASTSIVLNYKGLDPITGQAIPAQMVPGYIPTQVDIIESMNVAIRVVDKLKLADSESIKKQFYADTKGQGDIREWLAGLLQAKLEVIPSRESSVLDITFKGSDPQFAAEMANAFADAYQETSIQLKVEPSKKAASYFAEQIKILRDSVDTAQKKLSKFQQDNGLVTSDSRLEGIDVENSRLNELSAQLVSAQAQSMEAVSRSHQASGSVDESPDVQGNSLIQNLKINLGNAETKFAEVSQRLDVNHPQYQSAKAEVDKLRSELEKQIKATSYGVTGNAKIYQQREAEIRAALAAQKTRVLELNRTRDELRLMRNEVESAQRAYDTASLRLTQTSLEGQSNMSDIAILSPASPPLVASSPKIFLNTLLATFLGALLGVAFGMLAEMIDRRIRSPKDLKDSLGVPVLGTIDWSKRKKSRLAVFLKWPLMRLGLST